MKILCSKMWMKIPLDWLGDISVTICCPPLPKKQNRTKSAKCAVGETSERKSGIHVVTVQPNLVYVWVSVTNCIIPKGNTGKNRDIYKVNSLCSSQITIKNSFNYNTYLYVLRHSILKNIILISSKCGPEIRKIASVELWILMIWQVFCNCETCQLDENIEDWQMVFYQKYLDLNMQFEHHRWWSNYTKWANF